MNRGCLTLLVALLAFTSRARAWEPFRSQSSEVNRGNELLNKGQAKEALEAYDSAARKLPNEPGVQLNRGLALMKDGKLGPAREAFRTASQGSAPANIRGEALYDLGLTFMQEAENAAKGEQLEAAQKSLREAVDAFKGSLRAKPGNRDAAWNLELAKRRLVEVDKKKKEQDEEKKDEEKKDEEKKDEEKKQDQDAGTPPDEQPDAGAGEQKSPEQDQQGEQQKPEDQGKDDAKQDPQKQGEDQQKDQPGQDGKAPEPKDDPKNPQPAQGNQEPQPAQGTPEERMPEHMRKALDALESSEENLEKHRAQTRARQRPRRIQKDW